MRAKYEAYCPYCGRRAAMAHTQWGYRYECRPCDARVGCHPGTNKPLGTLANAPLRRARMAAHAAFDPLWKSHGVNRHEAYSELASRLGIHTRECHIGHFDETRCADVVRHAGEMTSAFTAALTPPPTEEGL